MKQVRRGIFETNSSSTHSVSIMSEVEFEKFKAKEVLLHDGELIPIPEDFDFEDHDQWEYKTYDDWFNSENETDVTRYTSPSGDKLVVLCSYGYDG